MSQDRAVRAPPALEEPTLADAERAALLAIAAAPGESSFVLFNDESRRSGLTYHCRLQSFATGAIFAAKMASGGPEVSSNLPTSGANATLVVYRGELCIFANVLYVVDIGRLGDFSEMSQADANALEVPFLEPSKRIFLPALDMTTELPTIVGYGLGRAWIREGNRSLDKGAKLSRFGRWNISDSVLDVEFAWEGSKIGGKATCFNELPIPVIDLRGRVIVETARGLKRISPDLLESEFFTLPLDFRLAELRAPKSQTPAVHNHTPPKWQPSLRGRVLFADEQGDVWLAVRGRLFTAPSARLPEPRSRVASPPEGVLDLP